QAFNPFDVPVMVNYQFPDPQSLFSENELVRGVLGVRGTLGTWDWEVYGLNSSENGNTSQANVINATAVAAALRSTNPATALNPFTANAIDPAVAALIFNPQVDDNYSSDMSQGSAFLRGSVLNLPAGELSMVVGGEWRREGIHAENRATNSFVT